MYDFFVKSTFLTFVKVYVTLERFTNAKKFRLVGTFYPVRISQNFLAPMQSTLLIPSLPFVILLIIQSPSQFARKVGKTAATKCPLTGRANFKMCLLNWNCSPAAK